jgi:hypothetical protein
MKLEKNIPGTKINKILYSRSMQSFPVLQEQVSALAVGNTGIRHISEQVTAPEESYDFGIKLF